MQSLQIRKSLFKFPSDYIQNQDVLFSASGVAFYIQYSLCFPWHRKWSIYMRKSDTTVKARTAEISHF